MLLCQSIAAFSQLVSDFVEQHLVRLAYQIGHVAFLHASVTSVIKALDNRETRMCITTSEQEATSSSWHYIGTRSY